MNEAKEEVAVAEAVNSKPIPYDENTELSIRYHCNREEKFVHHKDGHVQVNRRVTFCEIVDPNDTIVSQGVVKMHHHDVDNKHVAREFAFRKAMKDIPSKEVRQNLWNIFRGVEPVEEKEIEQAV
ncbi:MAG: hypothetical protein KUG81_08660 [Gammaproteobacteria bacterium]|nr:hypothetical protein [Gammaproteobacteria bacterium]